MATPLYNVGTATLTAGSTAMVGQGTLWLGNVRPGDQVVSYTGQTAIVGTVNSNTSITLLRAYRGTSQTAQAYEILYTPDDPFTQQLAREVLQGISASALVKLGGVTPAARKLVHFDAAANAALADLSDFGLNLLASSDVFGWGADNANIAIPNNNADTLTVNGVYRTISSTVGIPMAAIGQLVHMGQGGNVAVQVFYLSATTNRIWTRARSTGNNWTPWKEFGHPLLGTVSQSGGVPTGAIIERGSNANGEYVRFADGTQICWALITLTYTSGSRLDSQWTYPAVFSEAARSLTATLPYQTAFYTGSVAQRTPANITSSTTTAGSATVGLWAQTGTAFVSGDQISNVSVIVSGRWF